MKIKGQIKAMVINMGENWSWCGPHVMLCHINSVLFVKSFYVPFWLYEVEEGRLVLTPSRNPALIPKCMLI